MPTAKASKKTAANKKSDRKQPAQIPVATPIANAVSSSQIAEGIPPAAEQQAPQTAQQAPQTAQEKHMTLTFKSLDKRGRNAIFTGAAVSLRFPVGAFPNKTAPATIDVSGLTEKVAKTPRTEMTAEERKAARAAQPKLTLAEKVAKTEERLAKQRAKLAATQAPAVEQPSM